MIAESYISVSHEAFSTVPQEYLDIITSNSVSTTDIEKLERLEKLGNDSYLHS